MAPLVGAETNEVAVMETLTANLHLLMSSFYTPTEEKYKIIIEGKAFPSDHVRIIGNDAQMCANLVWHIPSMPSSLKSGIVDLTRSKPWYLLNQTD